MVKNQNLIKQIKGLFYCSFFQTIRGSLRATIACVLPQVLLFPKIYLPSHLQVHCYRPPQQYFKTFSRAQVAFCMPKPRCLQGELEVVVDPKLNQTILGILRHLLQLEFHERIWWSQSLDHGASLWMATRSGSTSNLFGFDAPREFPLLNMEQEERRQLLDS